MLSLPRADDRFDLLHCLAIAREAGNDLIQIVTAGEFIQERLLVR